MARRCSHCGHNGHNSRTCPDRGIRLFGVRLTVSSKAVDSPSSGIAMRKSASAGNLMQQPAAAAAMSTPEQSESGGDGYASDGLVQASSYNARAARKKGVPWSEEEHRLFLVGLHALGKGDWRGISRNYVTSRTPTQVASHAQKYFIRQSNLTKRKRRSSLFDIPNEAMDDTTSSDPRPHPLPPLAPQEDKESISSSASPPPSSCAENSRLWLAMSSSSTTCPPPDKLAGAVKPIPRRKIEEQEPELTRLSLGSANLAAPPASAPKPIRVV